MLHTAAHAFPGSGKMSKKFIVTASLIISTSVLLCVCEAHVSTASTLMNERGAGRLLRREWAPSPHLAAEGRGLASVSDDDDSKYLMVQCHRGQFSNRLMCLKLGVLLARTLKRVLVLPVFTDTDPPVDVSKYVSMECFRRNSQAVTFAEFRERLCRGVGVSPPSLDAGSNFWASSGPSAEKNSSFFSWPWSSAPAPISRRMSANALQANSSGHHWHFGSVGRFCDNGAVLQLSNSYSLADYRGYNCWARREDISNARDLGVEVQGCTHLPPDGAAQSDMSYQIGQIKRDFGDRPEKVLMFLDLFGVNLLPGADQVASTVAEPGQMCGWLPTEAASSAADAAMRALIPFGSKTAAQEASKVSDRALGGRSLTGEVQTAAPTGSSLLRGSRSYLALHLRRSDWFYYCAGPRHCFYSMTQVGAWVNATLAAAGMDTLYVSTNADEREKQMLRRAVTGRILFWEDVLMVLRQRHLEEADEEDQQEEAATGLKRPLALDDPLMIQMLEKSICMQAAQFVSSQKSTFSSQIRDFRAGGLDDVDRAALNAKFGADRSSLSEVGTAVLQMSANDKVLCDDMPPGLHDEHRLPDFYNPNLFVEQASAVLGSMRRAVTKLFSRPQSDGMSGPPQQPSIIHQAQPSLTLARIFTAPWRGLQRLVLSIEDGHAMSAANRFVEMYGGGSHVGLVLQGRQRLSAAALAQCVAAAVETAGAASLHVSMNDVPEDQQVLIMQELESTSSLPQITRMGGPQQERDSTFTLLWRGDGLARHAEPAFLDGLPTFLERTDMYVLAKSRIILGDTNAGLAREASAIRSLFGFDDLRDGGCRPEAL